MAGKAEGEWPELNGEGLRFAIVASRFNGEIVERLVEGAKRGLRDYGVNPDDIDVYWCPGALEIAPLARRVSEAMPQDRRKYDGIICCGAVIRGETDHYHFVAAESMRGVSELANEGRVAVTNAILTVITWSQAVARAGDDKSNKGYEAAVAAIVMARNFERLPA